jgi:hypothetical protein
MGIQRIEGFKYLDTASVEMTAPTSSWTRVAGRGNRYAARWTAGSGVGSIGVPILAYQCSIGFAAYHYGTGPASRTVVGIDYTTSGGSTFGSVSIGSGSGVGTDNNAATSSLSNWQFPDNSVTTEGWHWWNIIVKTSDSAGYFDVYRDGTLTARMAPDTYVSGGEPSKVWIRCGRQSDGRYIDISDLIIRDDLNPVPDSRVDVLELATTRSAQWTGSDGNSVDNHLLLQGTGPSVDLATYVQGSGGGTTDMYGTEPLPAGTGPVQGIMVKAVGASPDAATPALLTVNNATSSQFAPNTGTMFSMVLDNDPATSQPWTAQSIAAASFGLRTA